MKQISYWRVEIKILSFTVTFERNNSNLRLYTIQENPFNCKKNVKGCTFRQYWSRLFLQDSNEVLESESVQSNKILPIKGSFFSTSAWISINWGHNGPIGNFRLTFDFASIANRLYCFIFPMTWWKLSSSMRFRLLTTTFFSDRCFAAQMTVESFIGLARYLQGLPTTTKLILKQIKIIGKL